MWHAVASTPAESMGAATVTLAALGAAGLAAAMANASQLARAAVVKYFAATAAVAVGAGAVTAGVVVSPPGIKSIEVVDSDTMVRETTVAVHTMTVPVVESVALVLEDGSAIMATLDGNHRYVAPVRENGTYSVVVSGSNGKTTAAVVDVDCIDREIPVMERFHVADGKVTIYFSDTGAGVDWESIYATDSQDNAVYPLEVLPQEAAAVFAVPSESLTLYVSDLAGNEARSAIHIG